MTIIGLAILGVGLWALMFYSAPPSNLEPYESYQKSKKNPKLNQIIKHPQQTVIV